MKYILTLFLSLAIISTLMGQTIPAPVIAYPVYFDVSPPLRDMVEQLPESADLSWKDGVVFNYFEDREAGDASHRQDGFSDHVLQDAMGLLPSDTTIQNFEGLPNVSGYVPPDTHGEAGMDHFFQTVNCSYAIYNKSGAKILGPLANSSVWAGMPNNANSGDAIVLYDEQANRWLFSQFSLPNGSSTAPFFQMIAVSATSDPTGSWYRYQYEFSSMPDYPKFGAWPDGYYMSTNNFGPSPAGWVGNGAYAFDRAAMLAGSPTAARISFTLPPSGEGFISLLPSDCDGEFPPLGTPNYFTYVKNNGSQRLGVIEFHANWTNPSASMFGNTLYLPVTSFNTMSNGVPQLGTDKMLDPLSDRLMYRQQYRKFNGYSSMLLNHTVSAGGVNAGIRWYELRNTGTGWTIHQQSTYAPGDGLSRWMASIAQDTAGTIAMGYSVSGYTIYPGIRYTGRMKTDPPGQMTMTEKTIMNGGGAQTGIFSGRCRWGDYSGISIDPASPTTFWFTTEYYGISSSSNWQTRIASFTFGNVFSSAASATPAMLCSSSNDSVQLKAYGYGGSGNFTYAWSSIPAGFTSTLQAPKVKPLQSTLYPVVVSDGPISRYDTVDVKINPAPVVSAGNDTMVCWYVSPVPMNASASNYTKVAWGTNGDGYFSTPNSLETNYFPGIKDKTSGSVILKLMVIPIAPCPGIATSMVTLTLDPCTGTAENSIPGKGLVVSPNPADDEILVDCPGMNSGSRIRILSVRGETVSSLNAGNEESVRIHVGNLASGIYMVMVDIESGTLSCRFVKR